MFILCFLLNISGLNVIGVADAVSITEIGHFPIQSRSVDFTVSGDYIYKVNSNSWYGCFSIIDVSDPTAPFDPIAPFESGIDCAQGLAVSGNYVYTVSGRDFSVIDVSDPTTPVVVGSSNENSFQMYYANNVAISGNYAYVTDGKKGLFLINVSDPTSPSVVKKISSLSRSYYDVAVLNGYTYAVGNVLCVNDVKNYNNVKENIYSSLEGGLSVVASSNYLYVADRNGVLIFDITDPMVPILVGNYDSPGGAYDIALSDDVLFVAAGDKGLLVLDVTDKTKPCPIGNHPTDEFASHVETMGDIAYLYVVDKGLFILNIQPSGSVKVTSDPSDATIYIDNIYKGTTPLIIDNLAVGSHSLLLKKNGYEKNTSITVSEGSATAIFQILTQETATEESTITASETPTQETVTEESTTTASYILTHNKTTSTQTPIDESVPTKEPGFEGLLALIGLLVMVCLIKRNK